MAKNNVTWHNKTNFNRASDPACRLQLFHAGARSAELLGFSAMVESFPDPLGMGSKLSLISAIGSEVGCSILLILGLGTRVAVIPLAFTMVVALFVVHAGDPWKVKEFASIYLAAYAVIFVTGPGSFSLDAKLLGNSNEV